MEINEIRICDPKLSKVPNDRKKEFTEVIQRNEFIAGFKHIFNSKYGFSVGLGLIIYKKAYPELD